jgi:hypothetical protein
LSPDGVLSTWIDGKPGDYQYSQGTSMAAPHVTGVIGLMLSAGIPSNQVLNILHRTSMPLDGDSVSLFYGHGLINAYWAVNAVDKMRIVVGTRTGDLVEAIAEASVNPNGGNFEFTDLPPGDYQVFAWVDVQPGSDKIEPGDYFAETALFNFQGSQEYSIQGKVAEISAVDTEINAALQITVK